MGWQAVMRLARWLSWGGAGSHALGLPEQRFQAGA
jgi:hypothetical protein